jgi:type IV secretion system protein VirB10
VNNHYPRTFGSAILMSLISGGMAYTMDSLDSSSGQNTVPTMQLLQKTVNIKPTLEIRPGYQLNVIVTTDLVFEKPYMAGR